MLIEFKTLAGKWAERAGEEGLQGGGHLRKLKMCGECYAFFYNGSWHFEKPENLDSYKVGSKVAVQFTQCSACLQQEIIMYDMESELIWRQA